MELVSYEASIYLFIFLLNWQSLICYRVSCLCLHQSNYRKKKTGDLVGNKKQDLHCVVSCHEKPLNLAQWALKCIVSKLFSQFIDSEEWHHPTTGAACRDSLMQDYLTLVACLHTWCGFPSKLPWDINLEPSNGLTDWTSQDIFLKTFVMLFFCFCFVFVFYCVMYYYFQSHWYNLLLYHYISKT